MVAPLPETASRCQSGTALMAPQAELPSCQRKLASRIGLSADVFQTLDSGLRRNDNVFRGFFLKVAPLLSWLFDPFYLCASVFICGSQFIISSLIRVHPRLPSLFVSLGHGAVCCCGRAAGSSSRGDSPAPSRSPPARCRRS